MLIGIALLMSIIIEYHIERQVKVLGFFATNPINISSNSNSVTINSLNDNTDYEWRIKTYGV